MRIGFDDWRGHAKEGTMAEAVEHALDRSLYNEDAIGTAVSEIGGVKSMMARLIAELYEEGSINAEAVLRVLDGRFTILD